MTDEERLRDLDKRIAEAEAAFERAFGPVAEHFPVDPELAARYPWRAA